ncbi:MULTISPECIES: lactonase family protein [Bradyrhizobium]|uniref:lactonase family protein n=1 Tax=Bradyrhizobium TaxID=374 RepID=UPI0020112F4C|nr:MULTISPECIES: lactonase family protein [Bradyrhizobium]
MPASSSSFVYVGARTTRERNARGDGLNVYRMDNATGRWAHLQLLGDLVNPSFLAFDRSQRFLYTVHGDLSDITAMAIDPAAGTLRVINRQSTEGKNPVHLAVDPTNRFVVVANHITSTLALLPRHDDGSLGAVIDLVKLEGKNGPHRVEQPFAKPHQVEFDPSGRFIVVPDKGLDLVFTYRIDAEKGKLVQAGKPAQAREGAGPRHVAFHPARQLAYVVNELDSTVTAYRFDPADGALQPFQVLSVVPDAFTGNSRAAEIAVSADGRFVYASNRGNDGIATFAIDPATGRLSPATWTPSGGKTPRFFALGPSDAFLFAANEDSDTVIAFRRDAANGGLSATSEVVRVGSPVCILFRMA